MNYEGLNRPVISIGKFGSRKKNDELVPWEFYKSVASMEKAQAIRSKLTTRMGYKVRFKVGKWISIYIKR